VVLNQLNTSPTVTVVPAAGNPLAEVMVAGVAKVDVR